MRLPYGVTVTRLRPPATDDYGDPLPGSTGELDIPGCVVWPRGSSETNDASNTVIVGLELLAPAGTDLVPTDKVRVRGDVYDIDGDVGEWTSPFTGTSAGLQVALKKVEG